MTFTFQFWPHWSRWVGVRSRDLVCNASADLHCQLQLAISAHFLHSHDMRQLGAVCLNQTHKEEAAIVLGWIIELETQRFLVISVLEDACVFIMGNRVELLTFILLVVLWMPRSAGETHAYIYAVHCRWTHGKRLASVALPCCLLLSLNLMLMTCSSFSSWWSFRNLRNSLLNSKLISDLLLYHKCLLNSSAGFEGFVGERWKCWIELLLGKILYLLGSHMWP